MKVKAIKNFFLYSGERIELNGEYEMLDTIAEDLIKGGFVKPIETLIDKKTKTKTTKTAKDKKESE